MASIATACMCGIELTIELVIELAIELVIEIVIVDVWLRELSQ